MLTSKPWRAEAVIQLISGIMGCLCFGILAVGLLRKAGLAGFETPDSLGSVLVATLSFQGAALVLMLIFLTQHEMTWRDAIGLRNTKLAKSLLLAAGVVLLALPLVLALQFLSVFALNKLGWVPEEQNAVDMFVNAKSWWMRGYLGVFAVVLAPVAEEFLFRGVLFPFVKQLGWPKLAWVGVSLLFALIHFNVPTILPLFALALVFTWLYNKTDCLLTSMAAHCLFNGANLILLCFQHP